MAPIVTPPCAAFTSPTAVPMTYLPFTGHYQQIGLASFVPKSTGPSGATGASAGTGGANAPAGTGTGAGSHTPPATNTPATSNPAATGGASPPRNALASPARPAPATTPTP
jgi:hypothetical protein